MIKYADQYLKTAVSFIQTYDGSLPLSHFLKNSFAKQKKYGSKDRRFISHLCYTYFRLGHALKQESIEQRIIIALYLCGANQWAGLWPGSWKFENTELPERIQFIAQTFSAFQIADVFPFTTELSGSIDTESFISSFFIQPDLFIRLRPGKENRVIKEIKEQQIAFKEINKNCLAFDNATQIPGTLLVNKDYVVQDFNSQKIAGFLPAFDHVKTIKTWDCCAASGGKSIMAYDHYPSVDLTVSDVRKSILQNLQTRFREAGIQHFQSFVFDLSASKPNHKNPFDLIICDVPCSGSGTWSRTPEQLYFFKQEEIKKYTELQRKIVSNAIPSLKAGGYFLYITCSVFKEENEAAVAFIQDNFPLQLIKQELLKGYEIKADSMFAALFQK